MSAPVIVYEPYRSFIVFGGHETLSMEAITEDDLAFVTIADGEQFASLVWSSDCQWYFIVMDTGIALFHVFKQEGIFCRKRSAMFFDWFLSAPRLSRIQARMLRVGR